MHLVGHSLGGKVAAMAALEQADQDAYGSIRRKEESTIKILSLTMIDVSPVDYAEDESFAEVFRTLDIVDELHTHLPLVGKSVQPSEDSDGSSRSEDIVSRGLNTRVVLSDLVGERVSDPMLKAFLLANIQPKESVKEGVKNPGAGGLDDNIRAIMKRIASSREKIRSQHRVGFSSVSESESESENSSDKSETPEGFEWKFSVPGIVDFKSQLGGWPSVVPRQQYGEGDGDKGMEETDYIGTTVPLLGDKNDFKSSSLPQPFINPVLIMKGANSRFVRSSHISSISSMFPLFTLMTVRDAGHWLHFEKPKESSDSLIKFIRTVEDRVT